MTTKLAAVTLAVAMVSSSSFAAAPTAALRCTVQAPAHAVAGQPVLLHFTVSNTGATPLQLLRWNTPFEGAWFAPFVEVKRNGKPLPFQGPMIKRADPQAEDYLRIDAGKAVEAELDLALPFDLSVAGIYRVQPRIRVIDVFDVFDAGTATKAPRPRAEHQGGDLTCPTVEFQLSTPKG